MAAARRGAEWGSAAGQAALYGTSKRSALPSALPEKKTPPASPALNPLPLFPPTRRAAERRSANALPVQKPYGQQLPGQSLPGRSGLQAQQHQIRSNDW